jgi:orotidine-5'-phosphate decarboxylase
MKNIVMAIDNNMHPLELVDNATRYGDKIHSIKINSLYHFLLSNHNNALDYYNANTDVPLFADLKIYDTPNTVANTIHNLHSAIKYCTVVYNDNLESIIAASEAASVKGIMLFIVWKLTSSLPSKPTYSLRNEFIDWCFELVGATNRYNTGVVSPYYMLPYVKQFRFKHTLTPGVYIDEPNKGQSATISLDALSAYVPDLIVLGRSFREYAIT